MKILNVYRSQPDDTTKKLAEIVNRDREKDTFDLFVEKPDYDKLVEKFLPRIKPSAGGSRIFSAAFFLLTKAPASTQGLFHYTSTALHTVS